MTKKNYVLFLFHNKNTSLFDAVFFAVENIFRKIQTLKYLLVRQSTFSTHPSVIVLENVDAIKKRRWY
ncbi:MAG: hypothetical protein Q7T74_02255 [Candidatus Saccharibacteria bacterium]|nr:hypothetical protein [Candidatus Saccharibacteria bacterium]